MHPIIVVLWVTVSGQLDEVTSQSTFRRDLGATRIEVALSIPYAEGSASLPNDSLCERLALSSILAIVTDTLVHDSAIAY